MKQKLDQNDLNEDSVVSILRIKPLLRVRTPKSTSPKTPASPYRKRECPIQPTQCLLPTSANKVNHIKSNKDFTFSRVFSDESTNKEIFEYSVVPNLEGVLKGISFCVFTYGQTSSGKTYTMRGNIFDVRRTLDWLESNLGPHSSLTPMLSNKRRLREPGQSTRRESRSPLVVKDKFPSYSHFNATPRRGNVSRTSAKRMSIERGNRRSFAQSQSLLHFLNFRGPYSGAGSNDSVLPLP
jgi:hypothetical protein